MTYPRTVIVGAGFGGLEVAKCLKKAKTDVLLIDRLNHHLFQPLLYQVATAALSPGDIAFPARDILSKQPNASFIMGTVDKIEKEEKKIILTCGFTIPYDYLVLAPGANHSYFGNDQWEEFAPGLKTIQDALTIREKILMAFEKAERALSYDEAKKYLQFVIVGAGPTGVEMAGAIAEIAFQSLVRNFRKIRPDHAKIFLIEGAKQILPGYPEDLAKKAEHALQKLGVTVLTNHKVTNITPDGISMGSVKINAPTVIWAAGNQAVPVLKTLDSPLDRQGRVLVEPDLSVPGFDTIFVIGDAAHCKDEEGKPLPGLAPVAKQQGAYVAKIIRNKIEKRDRKAFVYWDKGSLATIGKGKAVGMVKKLELSGFLAWLAWSVIHIFYLTGMRNRILVVTQWLFWYFTGRRSIQIITRPIDSENNETKEKP